MVPMNVKTAVRKEGVPRGTPGKIVGFTVDRQEAFVDVGGEQPVMYKESEVEFLPGSQVQASHGEVERTKIAQGVEFARTGLPEELLELTVHFRDLAQAGYSPMFMERHLTGMGYNANLIRNVFKKVFGMEFEDSVNMEYIYSPGNIPQLNLGWGAAKSGGGHIFIMPMTSWYADFHQINDQDRVELHRHLTLTDALECVEKRVKKLMRWDPPMKKIKNPLLDVTQLYRQPQLFIQAMQDHPVAQELGRQLLEIKSNVIRKEEIDDAYLSKNINKSMHRQFLHVFCDLEEEAKHEVEKEAVEKALKSPDIEDLGQPEDDLAQMPVDVASVVRDYIQQKNAILSNFSVQVRGYTYSKLGPVPKDASDLEGDIALATAIVKIGLDVTEKATGNIRHAMLAFAVVGNEMKDSHDSIKDIETQQIYGLTDEGLADYFGTERGETPEVVGR